MNANIYVEDYENKHHLVLTLLTGAIHSFKITKREFDELLADGVTYGSNDRW